MRERFPKLKNIVNFWCYAKAEYYKERGKKKLCFYVSLKKKDQIVEFRYQEKSDTQKQNIIRKEIR